ncbi:hypothetical protein BD626DRAFT_494955 [Schizophyllum amplum]|uniref:Tim44-like domain-containing protein n=1 Tax=Schizophyllum amplum TaxID=97359 RepID=A0A550CG43_9AGAR|nr:hypothetical protein BD626DRAFT_494955 [Auriculariopsis ampla]
MNAAATCRRLARRPPPATALTHVRRYASRPATPTGGRQPTTVAGRGHVTKMKTAAAPKHAPQRAQHPESVRTAPSKTEVAQAATRRAGEASSVAGIEAPRGKGESVEDILRRWQELQPRAGGGASLAQVLRQANATRRAAGQAQEKAKTDSMEYEDRVASLLDQIEYMTNAGHDPFAGDLGTMDVLIPVRAGSLMSKLGWDTIADNVRNHLKSASSMMSLMSKSPSSLTFDAPRRPFLSSWSRPGWLGGSPETAKLRQLGLQEPWKQSQDQSQAGTVAQINTDGSVVPLPRAPPRAPSLWRRFTRYFHPWFSGVRSPWLAGMTREMEAAYVETLRAAAAGDNDTVRKYTCHKYQETALKLRDLLPQARVHIFTLHAFERPTQILSIRAHEMYIASKPPKHGDRFMIQALAKVDSWQSIESYDGKGYPLHLTEAQKQEFGTIQPGRRYPAIPRRVTEYLVFERKNWQDMPWAVREETWVPKGAVEKV